MNNKTLIASILLFLVSFIGFAQSTYDCKILVFRKSGETNIFHSNQILNIQLSKFDLDSVEHSEYISQAFQFTNGNSLLIPIADIDSVAFGDRNIIQPKSNIRRLSDIEADAFASIDSTHLYYKQGHQLLKFNYPEIVYYDKVTNSLPYGLCVKVNSCDIVNGQTVLNITQLDPSDIFERYFISNIAEQVSPDSNNQSYADNKSNVNYFHLEIPKFESSGVKASGNVEFQINAELTDNILDFTNNFYYAKFTLTFSPILKFNIQSTSSSSINFITEPLSAGISIPFTPSPIKINFDFGGFIDLNADLGIEFETQDNYSMEIEWTRKDGNDNFKQTFHASSTREMFSNLECHLNGELFAGLLTDASIGVLFNRIGAGTLIKLGPSLKSELSIAVLNSLANDWNPELYAKGRMSVGLHGYVEPYIFNHEYWVTGNKIRYMLPLKLQGKINLRDINLFPKFNSRSTIGKSTQAFVSNATSPKAIDIASYTETSLLSPLRIGFELQDNVTNNILCQKWDNNIINPSTTETQSFYSEFTLTDSLAQIKPENTIVRPIFRYQDKTIKTKPIFPKSGSFISQIVYHNANKGIYVVSGHPVVTQASIDSTLYLQGNILPIADSNSKYNPKREYRLIEIVDSESYDPQTQASYNLLIGTWLGIIDNQSIELTFKDKSTGSYCGTDFTYHINTPRKGGVSITMSNGSTITFFITSIDKKSMTIVPIHSNKQIILIKE